MFVYACVVFVPMFILHAAACEREADMLTGIKYLVEFLSLRVRFPVG